MAEYEVIGIHGEKMAIKEYEVICARGLHKCMEDGTLKNFPKGSMIPLGEQEAWDSYQDLVKPKNGVWVRPGTESVRDNSDESIESTAKSSSRK